MDASDLVETDVFPATIVKLRGPCRRVTGHRRRVLQRATIFQTGRSRGMYDYRASFRSRPRARRRTVRNRGPFGSPAIRAVAVPVQVSLERDGEGISCRAAPFSPGRTHSSWRFT